MERDTSRPSPGEPGYSQWFSEELIRRIATEIGYDPINQTNTFEKSKGAILPAMLLNGPVSPESPKDTYMRSEEFKHLPQIQRDFIQNLNL